MVFMYVLGSVPFESLENVLYMKYSNCSWARGVARWAELLSSERREKPCIPLVHACVFLWGISTKPVVRIFQHSYIEKFNTRVSVMNNYPAINVLAASPLLCKYIYIYIYTHTYMCGF